MKALSEAQRDRVHPLRGDRVRPFEYAKLGGDVVRAWRAGDGVFWERGIAHANGEHRERMRRALSIAAGEGDGAATDPACEASLMWMMDYWSRRSLTDVSSDVAGSRYRPVDEWFVTRWLSAGVPFALDVLAAFPRFERDASHAGQAATHALALTDRATPAWWALEQGHLGLLHALRRGVVAHAGYDDGVREAREHRASAPPWLRAAIAFVFPDEEAFYAADAAAAIPKAAKAKAPAWSWGLVTTRLSDDASLRRILEGLARDDAPWTSGSEDYGFSLVARLGDAAAPLLVHALGAIRAKSAKQAFAEALALTDSE